jgi:hypothetical protein
MSLALPHERDMSACPAPFCESNVRSAAPRMYSPPDNLTANDDFFDSLGKMQALSASLIIHMSSLDRLLLA